MEKYKYIKELIEEIGKEQEIVKANFTKERVLRQGVRKFDLVDLTLV